MATNGIKVNMAPSPPGDFIRTEVIEELGLNMTKASQILGVRRNSKEVFEPRSPRGGRFQYRLQH